MTERLGSRTFAKGHRLAHNQFSKSMPEHLMTGMNAEHDEVLSIRLSEIRNHKYPESRHLPPPAKFTKAHSSPGRLARSCSADEIPTAYRRSCRHHTRVLSYDSEQVHHTLFLSGQYSVILMGLQRPLDIQLASIWDSLNGLHIDDRPAATTVPPPSDPAPGGVLHDSQV